MLTPFVLDKASILDRLGGDEEIYAMMVDLYLQDLENNRSALAAALAAGDAACLQREVHTVKSLLATFSDDAGSALAQRLENAAKTVQAMDAAEVAVLDQRLLEVAEVLRG